MAGHHIISERLRRELTRRALTAVELAREAGVKTSFLYDILNGKSTNPSIVKLGHVARALGVSLAYLAGLDTKSQGGKPVPEGYVRVPRLDVAALISPLPETGQERYCFSESWIRERLRTAPEHLRMAYVRGDSMAPTLYDGDVLLIDTTRNQASPPGIFMLDDGVGLVPKRLEPTGADAGATLRVISDNPKYGAYECESREARIVGRVVWFGREM